MEKTPTGDPSQWSVDDVVQWLKSSNLDHVSCFFKRDNIDGLALLLLTENDLRKDMDIGVSIKIRIAIVK